MKFRQRSPSSGFMRTSTVNGPLLMRGSTTRYRWKTRPREVGPAMIRVGTPPTTTTNGAMQVASCNRPRASISLFRVSPRSYDPGVTSHRLFVNGEMWRSEDQSDDETSSLIRLFGCFESSTAGSSLLLDPDRKDHEHAQQDELLCEAIEKK